MIKKICIGSLLVTILCIFILAGCSRLSAEDTVSEQYQFDEEGRLINRITPDGSTIKFKYNDQGLPEGIEYPDDHLKYGYDTNGNRVWMQNRSGKTEYKYDAFDRLIEVTFRYSPEKRIIYEYDPWDRISGIKILGNNRIDYHVKYEYDILGNITSIDDGIGRIEYSYFPEKGEVVRRLPNGIKTILSYSPIGELSSLRHLDHLDGLIVAYRYEYDLQGKISHVSEETQDRVKIIQYEWDSRGYLKALHLPDGNSMRYEYDAMGNRISMTDSSGLIRYEYDKIGKLIKAGDIKYDWDRNGSLIAQIERNGETRFKYDARNLPLFVKTPNANIRYKWDGDGNMIERKVDKELTYFLPNPLASPGLTLAEFDNTGRISNAYLYGDALIGQRDRNGRMNYFLEDGFNSIRKIVDASGKIIGWRDYTPFGEPALTKMNDTHNFRMAGEQFVPEIKKYLIGNRLYDPMVGRYLSPDPDPGYIGRIDSFNRYTHGEPTPSNFMEPRANQTIKYIASTQFGNSETREESLEDDKNVHVFVSGILTQTKYPYMENIGTSALGHTPFPIMIESFMDVLRAPLNYFGLPGGKTRTLNELYKIQKNNPGKDMVVSAHSNGAITIYNLRKSIATASKEGKLRIKEIKIGGAGLAQELKKYFDEKGVNIRVEEINPVNISNHDIIGIISTTQKQLAKKIDYPLFAKGFFLKLGALFVFAADSFIPGEIIGIEHHSVEEYYPELLYQPSRLDSKGKEYTTKVSPIKESDLEKKHKLKRIKKDDKDDDDDQNNQGSDKPPFCPLCDNDDHGGGGGGGRGGGGGGGGSDGPGCPPKCCPPFCGGPPFGPWRGGDGGRGDGFNNNFKSIETKLGGIKLDSTAQFTENLGNITGAVYDPDKQVLVLVGDDSTSLPSIKPEDLAVALMSVFGPIPQEPQFSLDPDDPKNPGGEWLRAVYIPEQIIGGTEFGKALFEADWLLKQYSFGVSIDENKKIQKRESSVPGFKSTADLSLEDKNHEYGQERWARFWIVSDEMKLKQSGKSIYFDVAKMRVKAKKQVRDKSSPTGLKDASHEDDPIATEFANLFTKLYDEIAKESPEFERVRQLAKAVAIAKWIKQENIPIDTNWVNEYANKRVDTTGRITALSTQWEKTTQTPFQKGNQTGIQTIIRSLHLFGGVDLTVKPKYSSDDGTAQGLQKAVISKLREKIVEPAFDVKHNGKSYRAVILPVTRNGQEIWKTSPTTTVNKT